MKQGFKVVWLIVFAALLFGCASKKTKPDGDVTVGDEGPGTGQEGGLPSGADQSGAFQGHPLDDPASPLYQRVIYFDFDSSVVSPRDQEVLAAHAAYLANNPSIVLNLEGHADERGSREYNIGLGERRAHAVRRVLEVNQVQRQELNTGSSGEK